MPNPFETQLNRLVNEAIASGLNNAAEISLTDIKNHVQIQTGRLRDSYSIIQRATPDRLDVRIDSPLEYKKRHYPPVQTWFKSPNRALQGDPLWGTDASDTAKYEAMVRGEIEKEIEKRLYQ